MNSVFRAARCSHLLAIMLMLTSWAPSALAANGLVGTYCNNDIDAVGNSFELLDFSDVRVVRRDAKIDFSWGDSPAAGVNPDYFAVRWTGTIVPRYSEEYTFTTRADDGVRLYINGQLVISDWASHGPQEHSGTITLQAGVPYDIRLEFYDHFSGCCVKLMWESATQVREVVPTECLFIPEDVAAPLAPENVRATAIGDRAAVLAWDAAADDVGASYYNVYRNGEFVGQAWQPVFRDATLTPETAYSYVVEAVDVAGKVSGQTVPLLLTTLAPVTPGSGTGLLARYYNEKDLTQRVLVRTDAVVDFNWGKKSPDASIGQDTFSANWRGTIQPLYDGDCTFTLRSDDGMRLWIGGQVVVNDWAAHGVRERSGVAYLQAGQLYDIRVDYFENSGNAVAQLFWQSDLQPREIVPTSQLYPEEFLAGTEVKLLTPFTSITSPAWVEGKVGEDAVSVAVSVNGGDAFAAVRQNPGLWYASNAPEGAAPGIVLDPEGAVAVEVTATDAEGNAGGDTFIIDWTPTVLNGLTYSQDSVTIRQGDSLLFWVEPEKIDEKPVKGKGLGRLIQTLRRMIALDGDGDGTIDQLAQTDEPMVFTYAEAGSYQVMCRRVIGGKIGTLTVNVIGVDTDGPVACEVGFKREKGVEVAPVEFADQVHWIATDPAELGVSVKEYTDYGTRLYLTAVKRGTPTFQARLGSANGPLLVEQEVDEFTVAMQGRSVVVEHNDSGELLDSITMMPHVPNVTFEVEMFGSRSTFSGGSTKLTVNSNDFQVSDGLSTYEFAIERPLGEMSFCYSVVADQISRHGTYASSRHRVNGSHLIKVGSNVTWGEATLTGTDHDVIVKALGYHIKDKTESGPYTVLDTGMDLVLTVTNPTSMKSAKSDVQKKGPGVSFYQGKIWVGILHPATTSFSYTLEVMIHEPYFKCKTCGKLVTSGTISAKHPGTVTRP